MEQTGEVILVLIYTISSEKVKLVVLQVADCDDGVVLEAAGSDGVVLQGAAVERRDDDSCPGQAEPNTAQVPLLLTFPLHRHHLCHHHLRYHHRHHFGNYSSSRFTFQNYIWILSESW